MGKARYPTNGIRYLRHGKGRGSDYPAESPRRDDRQTDNSRYPQDTKAVRVPDNVRARVEKKLSAIKQNDEPKQCVPDRKTAHYTLRETGDDQREKNDEQVLWRHLKEIAAGNPDPDHHHRPEEHEKCVRWVGDERIVL